MWYFIRFIASTIGLDIVKSGRPDKVTNRLRSGTL